MSILIVVPYGNLQVQENRASQLKQFQEHMITLISQLETDVKFHIVISEQIFPKKYFNVGQLINIGVKYFINNCDILPNVIIRHDIDMLPDITLLSQYIKTIDKPATFLLPFTDEHKIAYGEHIPFGGAISAMSVETYVKINGFPNTFWGWGGEDNAVANRLKLLKIWYEQNTLGTWQNIDIQRKTNQDKIVYLKKNKLNNKLAIKLMKKDRTQYKSDGYNQLKKLSYKIQKNIITRHQSVIIYKLQVKLDLINFKETVAYNS